MDTLPTTQQDNVLQNITSVIFNDANYNRVMSLAKVMASGKATVPNELRNEGDCAAIIIQSLMWGMNPWAVAQKTHVISGKLGYEAQLVNAVINAMAPTKDRIHYEWFGPWEKVIGKFKILRGDKGEYRVPDWTMKDEEGCGVRAWATMKGEDAPRELELLLAQARTRNSTMWADDPRQQLAYLAVKRWSRLYCPDVILGVYTPDELEGTEKDITPPKTRVTGKQAAQSAADVPEPTDDVKNKIADLEIVAIEQGLTAYSEEWSKIGKEWRTKIGGAEHQRLKDLAEATDKSISAREGENNG